MRPGFFKPGGSPERTTERFATGPVAYTWHAVIKADIDALTKALAGEPAEVEGFVAALGPLSLGVVDVTLVSLSRHQSHIHSASATRLVG